MNSDKFPEQTKVETLVKISKSLNIDLFDLLTRDKNSYSFNILKKRTNYYGVNLSLLNVDTEFKKYKIPISFELAGQLESKQDEQLKNLIEKIYLEGFKKLRERYPGDISNDFDAEMKSGYIYHLMDKEEDIRKEVDSAVVNVTHKFETTYPLKLKSIKLNLLDKDRLNRLAPPNSNIYNKLVPYLKNYPGYSDFLAKLDDNDLKDISLAFLDTKIIEKNDHFKNISFDFYWDFLKKSFEIKSIDLTLDNNKAIYKN
ncbi:hypothetical protein FC81_GL000417 [Liquorilactobacillus capillatus DSM 19910]|uniref:Uncharacterized protein n=1 Tax=Liquorilactobacillus capillatus DSM 19910 TaxID=1423731 RepID=A0A0R1M4E3_9LACO|nr:hypothetical protein FC81_GL000417 [Liquorilactobacillus capillatus DSM 19910]